METARFCGDELHVSKENGDHRQARFLGDVIESGLARTDANAVASGAFRENDEVKLAGSTAKFLKFPDAARVEFATFEEKTDAAAENAFDPGGVPDGLVPENENGIASRAPAKPAKQNGVQQADVIADEKVAL
jgi:hypothetical protein